MDIRTRLQRLQERRYDSINKSITLSEAVRNSALSETERYILGSMEQVSSQQTEIVVRTGERVKSHLEKYLENENLYPDFEYQGSVTNNTHIKLNSDIDLLVVEKKFFTPKDGSYSTWSSYEGNPVETIRYLRSKCKIGLVSGFPAARVTEKSKCLGISGGSLQRDVDVVPCNWIKNAEYERTNNKAYLGIRVLDVDKNVWIENYPFLHNWYLNYKDENTSGNLKRIIRLLKTLKEDAELTIDVSSYDICGLVHSIDDASIKSYHGEGKFDFLKRFLTYSKDLETNQGKRDSIYVPNKTRKLFSSDGLNVSELKNLNNELDAILDEVRSPHERHLRVLNNLYGDSMERI